MPEQPPERPREPDENEIEERFRKLLGGDDGPEPRLPSEEGLELFLHHQEEKATHPPTTPEPPDLSDFDRRHGELGRKIEAAKQGRSESEASRLRRRLARADDPMGYRGVGAGVSAAYALVGFMALGWGIGWLIDRRFGETLFQPLLAMGGAIAGIVATFLLIRKSERRP